ncbi:hypothetical protein [Aeromonas salmonicida]|nr:hypothetical protein [Aeromonas salmonicida]
MKETLPSYETMMPVLLMVLLGGCLRQTLTIKTLDSDYFLED